MATYKVENIMDWNLNKIERAKNARVTVYQLNAMPTEKVSVKGFYADAHREHVDSAYGASLDLKLGNKVWAGGEYVKTELKVQR